MGDPREEQQEPVVLISPSSEIEAHGIASFLASEGIDCVVVPSSSTSFPGVLDAGQPWGSVRVPEGDFERAEQLLGEWRGAERPEPADTGGPSQYQKQLELKRVSRLSLTALLLAVLLPPVGLWLGITALREARREKQRPGNLAAATAAIAVAGFFVVLLSLFATMWIAGDPG